MRSTAKTVSEYLKSLPEDRQRLISQLRRVIIKNLPKGFVETMNWGMICYEVPLEKYPDTYNGQPLMYAALASQKNYTSMYLMSLYCIPGMQERFEKAFVKAGKKLNMGVSCVRIKKIEDIPLDVVGKVIASPTMKKYIESVDKARSSRKS